MGTPIVAAALIATAGLVTIVARTGLLRLFDRLDGGWHRPDEHEARGTRLVAVALAVVTVLLWIGVGIQALVS